MSASNKKTKLKKLADIKVEKVELQPLGAYVNDRVALIRQVFSCLKSKYIKSICPDVLASKSLQEIQEFCLDELLGISTKRLLAILNATECPSDTDSSSDNDSDAAGRKEYISLEEISSDDEMHEKNAANADNKEISVLELLELQARARAIRSQLALEPVTKIELDSDKDDEGDSSSSSSSTSVMSKVNGKPKAGRSKKKVKRPNDIEKMFAELDNADHEMTSSSHRSVPQPQPIRLKRNFLKRGNRPSEMTSDDNKEESNSSSNANAAKSVEPVESDSKDNIKKVEDTGCSSPDIITVVQSPETYSITDSEDEKESEPPKKVEISATKKDALSTAIENSVDAGGKIDEPLEEGEIIEEREPEPEPNLIVISKNTTDINQIQEERAKPDIGIEKNVDQKVGDETSTPVDNEIDLTKPAEQTVLEPTLTVDLADEELDYEMKDESEVESDSEDKSKKNDKEITDGETIEIFESSGDESSQTAEVEKPSADCPSFHERWLESKKVSKILATSRLGNRLRGNIKSKKAAAKALSLDSPTHEQATDKLAESAEPQPLDYDVDSVEHYKNLVSTTEKQDETVDKPVPDRSESNEENENSEVATNHDVEEVEVNQTVIGECSGSG